MFLYIYKLKYSKAISGDWIGLDRSNGLNAFVYTGLNSQMLVKWMCWDWNGWMEISEGTSSLSTALQCYLIISLTQQVGLLDSIAVSIIAVILA